MRDDFVIDEEILCCLDALILEAQASALQDRFLKEKFWNFRDGWERGWGCICWCNSSGDRDIGSGCLKGMWYSCGEIQVARRLSCNRVWSSAVLTIVP